MTLHRKDIVAALKTLLISLDTVFPPTIDVDVQGFESFRDLGNGTQDCANILSGKFAVTIDSGPENQWEGVRDCTVAYVVQGADRAARAARRDLAVPALEQALAADRTIGVGDPQVWAELGETTEDDDSPLVDAPDLSVALIAVNITYVAASAAG